MRIKLPLVLFAIAAFSFFSCNNDLKILAPYKDIPVVYGLLDQSDTAHYIRVNKAFLGLGNAYTMASNYDSTNYPIGQISVQIQDYDQSGNLVGTYSLTPDSSIPVDPGTFPYPHQVLYKTKAKLNVNDTYSLTVTNEHTGKVASGSTLLMTDANIISPWISSQYFSLSWLSNYPTKMQWNTSSGARIYQYTVRFFYYEKDIASGTGSEKYVDWVFPTLSASSISGGIPMEYDYTGQGFLQFLKGYIAVNSGVTRTADSVRLYFTSGSDDLYTYIQLSQPSLGINQEKPFYSDVKNAVGIFTSRHVQTFKKVFTVIELDSIRLDPITSNLNFQ